MRILFLSLALVLAGSVFATDSGYETQGPTHVLTEFEGLGDTSFTTLFDQDNNYAGNSFDIVCHYSHGIIVVGWDCNLGTVVPTFTIDIYWRIGTANGNETDTALWYYLGQDVVIPAGPDNPTHVNIGNLSIPNGETRGFIITAQEAVSGVGGFHYTNGGPTTFSNNDIDIITYRGLGEGWPPSSTYEYRQWNGTVHYDWDYHPALERSTWGAIKALDF